VDREPVVAVPTPSLVLMIGPAGSGKSRFCRRNFPTAAVISSDACREALSGDAADQGVSPAAFALAHARLEARLRRRRLAVLDATGLNARARASALALAARHHLPAVAIVLDVAAEDCVRHDATRADGRRVGRAVIVRHVRGLPAALAALGREGFSTVHRLHGPGESGRARVDLTRLPCDRADERGPFDVIGDLHGCLDELERLLFRLGYRREGRAEDHGAPFHPRGRRAVFVGDFVDRGPGVVGAARLVMHMVEAGAALAVPGNHDIEMALRLSGGDGLPPPGPGTRLSLDQIAALPRAAARAFAERFPAFVQALPSHLVLDRGRLVVAHAGLKREFIGRESEAVRRFALHGEVTGTLDRHGLPVRVNWARAYRGKAFVAYGHTPVRRAERIGNTINLATGCVYGGALSALRWPEGSIRSVRAPRPYYVSPRMRLAGVGLRAATRYDPAPPTAPRA
jgi:protein phosphatase